MNTYNHHKIINHVVSKINNQYPGMISDDDIKILKDASDFTDDFAKAELNYFLYHFYYDIEIEGTDFIKLSRNDENYNYNRSKFSMERCGDFVGLDINPPYIMPFNSLTDEKEFFSFINDRPKSKKMDFFDASNQSDNVAFLHAMGAENEDEKISCKLFTDHIIKCLCEFLFLQNYKKALFMLGIAFHSIMDSFTPSHTGFKKYKEQDMAKHAQGDVIPFMGDIVQFDPGQYTDDGCVDGKTKIAARFKGYNSNDKLNITEYDMLKIFIKSFLDPNDADLQQLLEDEYKAKQIVEDKAITTKFVFCGKTNSLSKINNELLKNKKYKDYAFKYSENAIMTIKDLVIAMIKKRQECQNNYETYKIRKEEISKLLDDVWCEKYNEVQNCPASDDTLYSNKNYCEVKYS